MAINWWGCEMPESWRKTQEVLEKLAAPIQGLNLELGQSAWQQNIMGATTALRTIQPHLDKYAVGTENTAILSRISEIQQSLTKIIPDYSKLFVSAEKIIPQIPKIPIIDWDWMSSAFQEYSSEYNEEKVQPKITSEIQEELGESVRQVLSEKQTNEAVKAKFIQWQEKNPVLAFIFLEIVIVILTNLVSSFAYDWISAKLNKSSNVYEEPRASSSVVININEESNIFIIDSVPYYYQVVYTDPDSGEDFTGYVPKKNVQTEPIETVDMSEAELDVEAKSVTE